MKPMSDRLYTHSYYNYVRQSKRESRTQLYIIFLDKAEKEPKYFLIEKQIFLFLKGFVCFLYKSWGA